MNNPLSTFRDHDFLHPDRHQLRPGEKYNPYTPEGAIAILRQFSTDAAEMLKLMAQDYKQYENASTALSTSPLKKKVWVAAALKTLGYVTEVQEPSAPVKLKLTKKAHEELRIFNSLFES